MPRKKNDKEDSIREIIPFIDFLSPLGNRKVGYSESPGGDRLPACDTPCLCVVWRRGCMENYDDRTPFKIKRERLFYSPKRPREYLRVAITLLADPK